MNWLWLVSYFLAGVFASNAVPHFVSGVTGHAFQTPFAKPPGQGLSSSKVNVSWGFLNLVVAWLLLAQVGSFDWRAASHMTAFGLGLLLMGFGSAHHFGKFHGGDAPGNGKLAS